MIQEFKKTYLGAWLHGKFFSHICTSACSKQSMYRNGITSEQNQHCTHSCRMGFSWRICKKFKRTPKIIHCNSHIIKCKSTNSKPCRLMSLCNLLHRWLIIAVILVAGGSWGWRPNMIVIATARTVLYRWWVVWNRRGWLMRVGSFRAMVVRRLMCWGCGKGALVETWVRLEIWIRKLGVRILWRVVILWHWLLLTYVGLMVVWLRIRRHFRSVGWWKLMKFTGWVIAARVRGRWNMWVCRAMFIGIICMLRWCIGTWIARWEAFTSS